MRGAGGAPHKGSGQTDVPVPRLQSSLHGLERQWPTSCPALRACRVGVDGERNEGGIGTRECLCEQAGSGSEDRMTVCGTGERQAALDPPPHPATLAQLQGLKQRQWGGEADAGGYRCWYPPSAPCVAYDRVRPVVHLGDPLNDEQGTPGLWRLSAMRQTRHDRVRGVYARQGDRPPRRTDG